MFLHLSVLHFEEFLQHLQVDLDSVLNNMMGYLC